MPAGLVQVLVRSVHYAYQWQTLGSQGTDSVQIFPLREPQTLPETHLQYNSNSSLSTRQRWKRSENEGRGKMKSYIKLPLRTITEFTVQG
jgi:hypothetical protein